MTTLKPVKHFTHTDLDGVGCAIVSKSTYNEDNVHAEYCDYNNVDQKVEEFLDANEIENYSLVLITDISVNRRVADKLNEYYKTTDVDVVLLDHHNTALWMNDYDWAYVYSEYELQEENRIAKSSGTSMLYDFLNDGSMEMPKGLADFAEQVRQYDTWEWDNVYKSVTPKELNDYLYMVGREKFMKLMLSTIPSNEPGKEVYFDVTARSLLDQRSLEIKDYIRSKNDQLRLMPVDENEEEYIGLVFAEQHVSELGNELCKMNPDMKYVMIVDIGRGKVSFRTIREDIDLGHVAKAYSGGGHPKAAGGKVDDNLVNIFVTGLI